MRRYTDKSGGVVVEKRESENKNQVEKKEKMKEPVSVSASDMIDTMYSYQVQSFFNGSSSEKGSCVICGKETAYVQRKCCVDCWKKYKEEILNGIKSSVSDVEFKID